MTFKLGLWAILPMVALLLAGWSFLALSVKRLHDRGLSTWLILVVVLPLLGAILLPGAAGENAVRLTLLLLMASLIWSVLNSGSCKAKQAPTRTGRIRWRGAIRHGADFARSVCVRRAHRQDHLGSSSFWRLQPLKSFSGTLLRDMLDIQAPAGGGTSLEDYFNDGRGLWQGSYFCGRRSPST